jgi:hypothetical protein
MRMEEAIRSDETMTMTMTMTIGVAASPHIVNMPGLVNKYK